MEGYQKKGGQGSLAFLVIVLSLLIALGASFAGDIFAVLGGARYEVDIARGDYYAVAAAQFDTASEARLVAEDTRMRGGAGYIIRDGDAYRVIAAVYFEESAAITVAARIDEASVYTVVVPALRMNFGYDQAKTRAINAALAFLPELTHELATAANALDEGKNDALAMRSTFSEKLNVLDGITASLLLVGAGGMDARLTAIIAELNAAYGRLTALIDPASGATYLSADARRAAVSGIFGCASLFKGLQKTV